MKPSHRNERNAAARQAKYTSPPRKSKYALKQEALRKATKEARDER